MKQENKNSDLDNLNNPHFSGPIIMSTNTEIDQIDNLQINHEIELSSHFPISTELTEEHHLTNFQQVQISVFHEKKSKLIANKVRTKNYFQALKKIIFHFNFLINKLIQVEDFCQNLCNYYFLFALFINIFGCYFP